MPYQIVPVGTGYKVISQSGKPLSNKPLSLNQARKQKVAVALGESRRTNKPVSFYM